MRGVYTFLFPAVWAAWCIYWFLAALGAKPVRRVESLASRLMHYVPLIGAILLLVSPRLAGTVLSHPFLSRSIWHFWIGAMLLLTGLIFATVARRSLGGNWSSTVTLKQDHTLTQGGPYRFVRHLIYAGILLAILGSAVADGEWRDLLALALVFIAFLRKIQVEERFMLEQFGDAYARYRQEVAALIPGLL